MRPEQSAIKELFLCLKCSALMAILNVGAWVIWTRPQICRNAADKEPYGRLIKWFCLETAVTLTRSLWDAFTNQLWLRIGFNSPCRWLNLCYLSLSLSATSLGNSPPHGFLWAICLCHLLTACHRNILFCCHKTMRAWQRASTTDAQIPGAEAHTTGSKRQNWSC